MLTVLFLGDVVGKPGRSAVIGKLPELKERFNLDFIIVNGENAAGGRGITGKITIDLLRAESVVITRLRHLVLYVFFCFRSQLHRRTDATTRPWGSRKWRESSWRRRKASRDVERASPHFHATDSREPISRSRRCSCADCSSKRATSSLMYTEKLPARKLRLDHPRR